MHGVADPEHASALFPRLAKQGRQAFGDLVRAHARNEGQPPGLVVRVQHVSQFDQDVRLGPGPDLDGQGIVDPAGKLEVRLTRVPRALADPEEVCRAPEPLAREAVDPRKRLLVGEQQGLVAGEEIDGPGDRRGFRGDADGGHERHRVRDPVGVVLVELRLLAAADEIKGPLVNFLKIRIAALREGAQQVQRRRCLRVGLQHAGRVGCAALFRERDVVDDVAPVDRESHSVLRLRGLRARLGELPGDPAELHHGHTRAVREHDGHLEEDPKRVPQVVGAELRKTFRAVAALEHERAAFRRVRQLRFQTADLAAEHERGMRREFAFDLRQCVAIAVVRHLAGRAGAPAVRRPLRGHRLHS